MARYNRVEDIIRLALALQAPGRGLCLEDVQERFGVGRRTAERMREAVDRLYPGMTSTKDPDGRKYWRLPPGEANGLIAWRAEELRALDETIRDADSAGLEERARALASLRDRLCGLSREDLRGDLRGVSGTAETLRRAVVEGLAVHLSLAPGYTERFATNVHPHGVLGGRRPQLVIFDPKRGRPGLVPLAAIEAVQSTGEPFERQAALDLRRFATNALAAFEDGPLDVAWNFAAHAADEVLAYDFHPEQELEIREDGTVDVRFRADGIVEMAWHLFAWGERVKQVDAPILKHRFDAMLARALRARTPRRESGDRPEAP